MPERSSFTMRVGRAGPDAEVIICGELDLSVLPALSGGLASLRETTPGALAIDLAGVEFIDCTCARVIIATCQDWPGPGQAVIRAASPIVRRVFELTGLTAVAGADRQGIIVPQPAAPGLLAQITASAASADPPGPAR